MNRDRPSPWIWHPHGSWSLKAGIILVLVSLVVVACEQGAEDGDGRLIVTVSILPQAYFVQEVGQGLVSVNVMVEPGANPATYEPKSSQMRALSDSDCYVSVGVPFEAAWLDRITAANPDMLMADSTPGIELRSFPNGVVDPHIWLSPRRVAIQAQNIALALIELDADHEAEYRANLERFEKEVEALDFRIAEMLAPHAGQAFVVDPSILGVLRRGLLTGDDPHRSRRSGTECRRAGGARGDRPAGGDSGGFRAARVLDRGRRVAEEIEGEVLLIDPLAEEWAANLVHVTETMAGALGDDNS